MYAKGSATHQRAGVLLCIGLIAGLGATACSASDSPSPTGSGCIRVVDAEGKKLSKCLPIAPQDKRVDLTVPAFSNPTSITNPLHPSSNLTQVMYGGLVDGKPFRTEFTLLPDTKTIAWNGKQIKVVAWQYLAYSDGRIKEIALDWFAQADDGSVWYFGEDVTDYEDGVVASHDGSWLAGKDGPPAMIMPASPKVGDVYRVENIPEFVFEEITVSSVGQTVPGPSGPVKGAMVVRQLHMDGSYSDKTFAPGYGEFSTGHDNDYETASLALPTDALTGAAAPQLAALSAASRAAFDSVGGTDWAAATTATSALKQAWDAHRAVGVPPILDKQMSRDIDSLTKAVADRKAAETREAALRVAQNETDLRLRHESVVAVDKARLALWARQLIRDAAAGQPGAVAGDATTLTLIWNRIKHAVDQNTAAGVEADLAALRTAADKKDLSAAAQIASGLVARGF